MIPALFTASTGMIGNQMYVDTISNNIANVNTTGFKKNRVDFQDLLYQEIRPAGAEFVSGATVPCGIEIGLGVRPTSVAKIFKQGDLVNTSNPLDVAIEGTGFLQVAMPDGSTAYTRDGAIKLDTNSEMVTPDGFKFIPTIAIPTGTVSITIGNDGTVSVLDQNGASTNVGTLQLAMFANPQGLKAIGKNLFTETPASGAATLETPGNNGAGTLAQGFLELSNVQIVEEMVNLILAQRAYEMNSKAIRVGDDMLQTAGQLR
ncbi:MAG: flagellar basal-body rod protein FlgG [Candidatus Aureabacteria bacterium]|nr:flagellar basal-body rod protein FlgG [Candidatus Auribacterota bacterium]